MFASFQLLLGREQIGTLDPRSKLNGRLDWFAALYLSVHISINIYQGSEEVRLFLVS